IPLSRTDSRRGRYARLGPALLVFLAYFVVLSQARSAAEEAGSMTLFFCTHLAFWLVGSVLLLKEELPLLLRRVRETT
ncbi:LPS export ABC transporter permease LptF, partial [Luminiphilus sp.]|nr:LPS export ABC transporter permease LptF [Luminiphilus sp.]